MTPYEILRCLLLPIVGPLPATVHSDLKRLPAKRILDVGARNSPYTIGLKARVILLDIPQVSDTQARLRLGWTNEQQERIRRRRSNIDGLVLEDMTECSLPDESFDGVVSIETIEHVDDPEAFVAQIARVTKPGGWVYLTTPNGDFVKNTNPDHRRHLKRRELSNLVAKHYSRVDVRYALRTGKNRARAIRGLKPRHPIQALGTICGTVANRIESRNVRNQVTGTAHLIVTAWKV